MAAHRQELCWEFYICRKQEQKHWVWLDLLKPKVHLLKTYFLKKVMPISTRPHLLSQVAPLPDDQTFKSMSLMVATLTDHHRYQVKVIQYSRHTEGGAQDLVHRASTPLPSLCPSLSQSTSLSAPLSSRPPLVWPWVNGSTSILIQSTTVHTQPVSSGQANYFSLFFRAF